MSQGGRICRKVGRGGGDEDVEIEIASDRVVLRVHGKVVRTLTGADADAVRAAADDPDRLDRLVARLLR